MRKRSVLLVIATASVALLLASCSAPVISVSDAELSYDSNGHMTSDVTYTYYDGSGIETDTFSAAGTYEYVWKTWDAPSSSWRQSDGAQATYSYDTSTRLMTFNYTQFWNGGVGGSYVTPTSTWSSTKTETYPMILGSSNCYWQVLTGKDGNYESTDNSTAWNGLKYTNTMSATIASDLSTVTTASEWEAYSTSGVATNGSKSSDVMTKDQIFPSTVKTLDDAKGKVITFTWLTDVSTPYTWNSGTNFSQGVPTTNHNAGSQTLSSASDGSWVAWVSYSQARHLTVR